jgi:hypothetical protein
MRQYPMSWQEALAWIGLLLAIVAIARLERRVSRLEDAREEERKAATRRQ